MRLPSDEIWIRNGYDGTEPPGVVNIARNIRPNEYARVSVAITTYYPEVRGAYYFNSAIIGEVVQAALGDLNVGAVLPDPYRMDGIVPVEPPNSLVPHNETYVLMDVTSRARVGKMIIWSSVSPNASFHSDRMIADAWLPPSMVTDYRVAVLRRASDAGIKASEVPDAAADISAHSYRRTTGVRAILSFFGL